MKKNLKKTLIIGGCGYIGTRLCNYLNSQGYNIVSIDLIEKYKSKKIKNIKTNFKNLKVKYLKKFQYILILAAHSSVPMCNEDPTGAIENNIVNTKELLLKIKKARSIPLFFSTAAIYNGSNSPSTEDDKHFNYKPNQLYDITKYYIEKYIVKNFGKYFIFRLGTLSGFSPNIDKRLIINKMYYDSIDKKKITVVSKNSKKSLLFIDDFCKAIEAVINNKKDFYGMYNLNSINLTVGEIANEISKLLNPKVIHKKGTSSYSFYTSNKKFRKKYNFHFTSKISEIVRSFEI